MDAVNSENAPTAQNNTPNQGAIVACSCCPSIFRKLTLFGSPACPNSVECASMDVRAIVTIVTSTNVNACSRLTNRHHRRHPPPGVTPRPQQQRNPQPGRHAPEAGGPGGRGPPRLGVDCEEDRQHHE